VTVNGVGGSVDDPGIGVFTYGDGNVVSLVASADSGYVFETWSGDTGTIADVNSASTEITMNDDYTITANFSAIPTPTPTPTPTPMPTPTPTPIQRTLTVTVNGVGGSVDDPGIGVFTYGDGIVVDLVASPDSGYVFQGWTGDVGRVADPDSPTTTITMNDDYAITATFAPMQ